MKTNNAGAKLGVVAEFPKGTFLENLAVRSDNSLLVIFEGSGTMVDSIGGSWTAGCAITLVHLRQKPHEPD